MATKIEYWDADALEWMSSREEYEELRNNFEYSEEVGNYYRHYELRSVTGYLHVRTSLIVTDIRKFENWLKKIEKK